ncbi:YbhB/YbcL family Raf kinase inhibitor-like protein [Leucobacter chromiireducens]|uniref:YbhB/YbcL family Raf kinase inhibitor-like protein n=1 Tax=Leucobacter chromiireducens subsp. solipictus TaxID=398235 RepID=A0ABS1SMQ1_9MICO|nr:YbhB/YbcL family Raf kinase inhibitor-like protein [Leucobacter chromiireducens]MBL3680583.1 YbhB/YbcL family Raf kinase inhibitor-like protein [Leucobacter chromiireducens subsp. solipictus]
MTQASQGRGAINPYAQMRQVPGFTLTSADIQDGEPLPAELYGAAAGGANRSPQLSWSGFPAETRSFAVTCFDPDAPTGSGFWHWAVAHIPASVTQLAAGAGALAGTPGSELLPEGALTLPNERREPAFRGASPPAGTGVHHYWFVVHALNVPRIEIDPEATPAILGFMMREAVLARAIIVATGEFGQAA